MTKGRVYLWKTDGAMPQGGAAALAEIPLLRLDTDRGGKGGLSGFFVSVRNGVTLNLQDPETAAVRATPIGNASPDANGDYLFSPGMGGGRIDRFIVAPSDFRERYIQAARFGEVNAYYHADLIADYVHGLLERLGAPPLPKVTIVVNAHASTIDDGKGNRDGVKKGERWLPFQGGHYRLPARTYRIKEPAPISLTGEIHLGPGWSLKPFGTLRECAGRDRYRPNASHNAGIIYHEYGHHVCRHIADFQANALRAVDRQDNRKCALEEGMCDYWAATMLDTPLLWSPLWSRYPANHVHPRSLTSAKTMVDFDFAKSADPHTNGTIWASALWDARTALSNQEKGGARRMDILVLQALLLIGSLTGAKEPPTFQSVRRARRVFSNSVAAILEANERLFSGRHQDLLVEVFAQRGIEANANIFFAESTPKIQVTHNQDSNPALKRHADNSWTKRVSPEEIAQSEDLYNPDDLSEHLRTLNEDRLSVLVAGDIMLGGRSRRFIKEHGPDYPFTALLPLLKNAHIVLGNLEGPLARHTQKQDRNFSYRVNPRRAKDLLRANISVVTLANNHLMDCGREGVLETIKVLNKAGVHPLGAGIDEESSRLPVILDAEGLKVGLLGYYWNRRCAARKHLPGGAMDTPEALQTDIGRLRPLVDRIVVTFHWGIPYDRVPSADDRAKARLAVECGADAVVGHHPHVLQPFEIHRDRPIFYSVGNFAFGSGNSKGEGVLVGFRFEKDSTDVIVYPLYVKNRDARVAYQPKVLKGDGARHVLARLSEMSGPHGTFLSVDQDRGRICLPYGRAGK